MTEGDKKFNKGISHTSDKVRQLRDEYQETIDTFKQEVNDTMDKIQHKLAKSSTKEAVNGLSESTTAACAQMQEAQLHMHEHIFKVEEKVENVLK